MEEGRERGHLGCDLKYVLEGTSHQVAVYTLQPDACGVTQGLGVWLVVIVSSDHP